MAKPAFSLAVRFVSASKGQGVLVVAGIAVGIAVQLFIGGLINGLQQGLIERTVGNTPHVTVSGGGGQGISGYARLIEAIRGREPALKGITPVVDAPVLASGIGMDRSVLLRGMDLATADGVFGLTDRVYAGRAPKGNPGTMLGRELAEELGLGVGDDLRITTSRGKRHDFRITGLFDLGVAAINRTWVIVPIGGAQAVAGTGDTVTSVAMSVKDVFKADAVADGLKGYLEQNGLMVSDWKAENAELLAGLKGQGVSSLMIQACVLVAVALGIASVLAMTVMQKSRQLGILKAMGLTDRDAGLVFMLQGLMLGAMGTVAGVVMGLGLGWAFTVFARNPDGTAVAEMALTPGFTVASMAIALLVSGLAALVPALRSLRLDPIEVIRNG